MANDQQFYVGQKALIEKEGEVLVLNDPLLGSDFPGGKVQEGETDFINALRREVEEETSLEIEVGDPFTIGHFEYPVDSKHRNAGKKIYLVLFKCKYLSGIVKLSNEHDAFAWVNKENYKEKITKSWEQNILKKYFSSSP